MKRLTASVAALGFLMTGAAASAQTRWTVSEASPGVSVVQGGRTLPVVRGQAIGVGDLVVTGANGRATLVRDRDYVIVSPGSRLKVTSPGSDGIMQFFEYIGAAVFSIDKETSAHFGVKTKYLAAVVKGTTFSVTTTDHDSKVDVLEGAVDVIAGDGGMERLIAAGDFGRVRDAALAKVITSAGAGGGSSGAGAGAGAGAGGDSGDDREHVKFDDGATGPFRGGFWHRPVFSQLSISWHDLIVDLSILLAGSLIMHVLSLAMQARKNRRRRK